MNTWWYNGFRTNVPAMCDHPGTRPTPREVVSMSFIITSKTCKQCGETKSLSEFYSDKSRPDGKHPYCRTCKLAYQEVYSREHAAEEVQRAKDWQRRNPDKVKEYQRTGRQRHKESIVAYNKVYNAAHREYYTERMRVWRANNPERSRANKLIDENRRRARKSALPATFTAEDWTRTLELFGNVCAYCGTDRKLHQDHFIPVALDGPYEFGNIVPACKRCNSSKHDTPPEEWCDGDTYAAIMKVFGRD